jgi:hypothetical protein
MCAEIETEAHSARASIVCVLQELVEDASALGIATKHRGNALGQHYRLPKALLDHVATWEKEKRVGRERGEERERVNAPLSLFLVVRKREREREDEEREREGGGESQ